MKLDARIKLGCALAWAFTVAFTAAILPALTALLLSGALLIFARPAPGPTLRRLLGINIFIMLLCLPLPFTLPGQSVMTLGRLSLSREGLELALIILLRANAIVLLMLALLKSCTLEEVIHGLQGLGAPDKLIFLIFLTCRYAGEIKKEYLRMLDAMRLRAFKPATNLHTYRATAYLVGMLLVKSHERGTRICQAMLCRGFSGSFPRLENPAIEWTDYLAIAIAGASITVVGLLHAI